VDGDILRSCGIESCPEENIVELANGCLCCTVADDFIPAIEARYRRLLQDGIAPRRLDPTAVVVAKASTLDRVQQRAEEYEYLGHN